MLRATWIAWAVVVTMVGLSGRASAQDAASLDLRGFSVPTDPASMLTLQPAQTPGSGNWNVAAWASYAPSPIVMTDATGREQDVISHQLSVDYLANVGLGDRLALGLVLPTVVYQTGDDVALLLPDREELPTTALGDLALTGKATLLSPTDLGGFGLALLGRVSAPTGTPGSFVSEDGVRGGGSVLGELGLLAIALRGSVGARFRSTRGRLIDDGTDRFEFGHDLPWAAGITFRPQILGLDNLGRWRWNAEIHGSVSLTPAFARSDQSPVLASLSARYTVDEVSAIAGLEAPLNDAIGNPIVRPVLGIGWAPRFEDEDGDGIEDDEDECPELEEDADGFEDHDGCPDFDDDDDGVPDEDDQCPGAQEDIDEFADGDGCPDPDNDGDGLPDTMDPCPLEAAAPGTTRPGCPLSDPDGDGLFDDKDRCVEQPEDKDGHEDDDGCPDPDNDGDGVADTEDRCPNEAGRARPDTDLHGCPSPDQDGDALDGADDQCPAAPEDYDGVDDDDGCPDLPETPERALASVEERDGQTVLVLRRPIRFDGDEVAQESLSIVRAVAAILNKHPDWIIAAGVRPVGNSAQAEQTALNRSLSIALRLREMTYNDAVAEAVGWGAVSDQPKATATGVGLLLLPPPPAQRSESGP